jgi:protein SCO1/2
VEKAPTTTATGARVLPGTVRNAFFTAVILAVIGTTVLLLARGASGTATPSLQGTVLQPVLPAPAVTLQDQNGATIALAKLRGHPVVLTFLDSVCPHRECPLIATQLAVTARQLGPHQASELTWVAVSVDPWHDTPATVTAFLAHNQVTTPLHFLLGTLPELTLVWKAYGIESSLLPDGIVAHNTGVYVLDAKGRERVFLSERFDPKQLSTDLHIFLTDPSA